MESINTCDNCQITDQLVECEICQIFLCPEHKANHSGTFICHQCKVENCNDKKFNYRLPTSDETPSEEIEICQLCWLKIKDNELATNIKQLKRDIINAKQSIKILRNIINSTKEVLNTLITTRQELKEATQ